MFAGYSCIDIRSSHIVEETSACVCHLYKGNSHYADTFTTAQADLSLRGRLGVCCATIYIKHPSHYKISSRPIILFNRGILLSALNRHGFLGAVYL